MNNVVAVWCKDEDKNNPCKKLGDVIKNEDGRLEFRGAKNKKVDRFVRRADEASMREAMASREPGERWTVAAAQGSPLDAYDLDVDREFVVPVRCRHGKRYIERSRLVNAASRYRGEVINITV